MTDVFPLRLQWTLLLPWRTGYIERIQSPSTAGFDPRDIIKKALPNDAPLEVTGVIPRLKDGGAFVRLSHPETVSSIDLEHKIRNYLKETVVKPWWNPFAQVHMHVVRGRPWVEDLFRPPSSRLKIEFMPPAIGSEAMELSQEVLYSVFRPYGKLREIYPQPADSKVLPKYATLDFSVTRRAIMAKNCLHGFTVAEENEAKTALAKLRITYERKQKTNWIKDWLVNHPRITIPIMAALIAAITVAVFDPYVDRSNRVMLITNCIIASVPFSSKHTFHAYFTFLIPSSTNGSSCAPTTSLHSHVSATTSPAWRPSGTTAKPTSSRFKPG